MMQSYSYHTHTNFSDGQNSLEEMLTRAVELGWTEIGISDHLVVHKNMRQSPSYEHLIQFPGAQMYRSSFESYKDEFRFRAESFRKTAALFPIKVYLGYEVDYFCYTGWEEELRAFLKDLDYDYLISGNHFFQSEDYQSIVDVFRYDETHKNDSGTHIRDCLKRHYQTIEKAVRSGLFTFLAHPDYARKVSAHALYPLKEERLSIVKALKDTNTACEISTKGLRKIGDYYPERFVLEELIKAQVPLVISDDAHKTDELGYAFKETEDYLKTLNCQKRFQLKLCS